jgi:hypothetical protein
MARDGRPGWPLGKSISSTTFRPMRLWTCALRIDRRITRVFPDPAGALITETRFPSVSTDSTAAA